MNIDKIQLDGQKLERASEMLKAIAHPTRMAIIELLGGGMVKSVTEIYETLGIEQAVASHHLGILKNKGVLNSEREGKSCMYSLKHDTISNILVCIDKCQKAE